MGGKSLLSIVLMVAMLPVSVGVGHAAPTSVVPRRIVFSASEYSAYESVRQRQRNRLVIALGSSTLGTLLAAGVTFLAIGLSDIGNAAYTTGGVTSLCLAVLGGFTALDLYEW